MCRTHICLLEGLCDINEAKVECIIFLLTKADMDVKGNGQIHRLKHCYHSSALLDISEACKHLYKFNVIMRVLWITTPLVQDILLWCKYLASCAQNVFGLSGT